jgi:hypothetical protein
VSFRAELGADLPHASALAPEFYGALAECLPLRRASKLTLSRNFRSTESVARPLEPPREPSDCRVDEDLAALNLGELVPLAREE